MINIKQTSLLIKLLMKHINDDTKKPIIRESLNVFKMLDSCAMFFHKSSSQSFPQQESFLSLKCFTVPFLVM